MEAVETTIDVTPSFFSRPETKCVTLPYGPGVPFGTETVKNQTIGIAGVYGAWGESYDNQALAVFIEKRLGEPLPPEERMNLSELGFDRRHHLPDLSDQEHLELEVEVGARFLRQAAAANGWETSEVEGVLIGLSGPVSLDYTRAIATRAGVPSSALTASVHKACDGSMGALHLALNPSLSYNLRLPVNLAAALEGKKVLVGGIEGLSRFTRTSRDKNALQLFGTAGGVIGVTPGKNMKFVVGRTSEVYDEEGVLQAHMYYPHSRQPAADGSLVEAVQVGENDFRLAGLLHEPADDSPVAMAGPMGMVKLFVRSGVEVVRETYQAYRQLMEQLGRPAQQIRVAIVHHANLKINKLKEKHLQKEGITLPMPWLLSDFGNVSAASNMIAFLRKLPELEPGDHVLFDGFGAGTYYDVLAVELGRAS